MPKHKAAPGRELTKDQTTKVQSSLEQFQQKWGMELTAAETTQIIERATEQIADPQSEVGIKPAVRDQLFAHLISHDPEKAMELRISAYENRGKTIKLPDKAKVMRVAREKGFRAANRELRAALKTKTARKASAPRAPSLAKAKPAPKKPLARKTKPKAGASTAPKAKIETDRGHQVSGGKEIREVLQSAARINQQIEAKREEYMGKMKQMRDAQFSKFREVYPETATIIENNSEYSAGEVKSAEEIFGRFADSQAEYAKERKATEAAFSREISPLKKKRDELCVKAYSALMQQKQGRGLSAGELKGLEEGLNTRVAAGFSETTKRDTFDFEEARQNTVIVGRLIKRLEMQA